MDPFTEKLLERTRARRENLQRKMAERPTSANRPMAKRIRDPLTASNGLSDPVTENVPPSLKPSPSKRRCSDDKELSKVEVENVEPPVINAPALSDPPTDQKPPVGPGSIRSTLSLERKEAAPKLESGGDVLRFPAGAVLGQDGDDIKQNQGTTSGASAIRSRLQRLADQRQYWDSDAPSDVVADVTPVSPVKNQEVAPIPMSSDTPLGRRGRLANLAATIGSWEDEVGSGPARKDNAQTQPGTACLPATRHGAATGVVAQPRPAVHGPHSGPASANKPILSGHQSSVCSPVKPGRVALPSSQKSTENVSALRPGLGAPKSPLKAPSQQTPSASSSRPVALTSQLIPPSSPHKTGLATIEPGKPTSQSPLRNQSPAKDLGSGRDAHPRLGKPDLLTKPPVVASSAVQSREVLKKTASAGTPGGPGVKSFLERFGERCQERSVQNSPVTPAAGHSVTPRTRLVQEKLMVTPVVTSAADLAQKNRQERENELQQLRSRFQKGSMWKPDQDSDTKLLVQLPESDAGPSPAEEESTAPPVEALSTAGSLTGAVETSPASSPAKAAELHSEKVSEDEQGEKTGVRDTEMNADEANSSEVINKLFHGVLEDSKERNGEDDDDNEEEEEREVDEDALNISSMSLLTPVVETVAAVTKSPEMKLLTSTPVSSFNEKSRTPDSAPRSARLQRTRIRRTRSSESLDGVEGDQNLPYSVDAYRSTRIKDTARPTMKQVIVRKEEVSQKDAVAPTKHINIKQKIKDLTNEMNLQQTVIHQASQALNCCTDEEHGKGSQVEAEAERLLLIATEKRSVLKAELDRLKAEGPMGQKKTSAPSRATEEAGLSASKGSISVPELRLPLKAEFVCSAASRPETANYYFFIMIRAGPENTVATPLASTRSALSGDALTFSPSFTLPNVSNDFEIDVEVYCLVQKRELCSEKKKKPSKSKAITPKRFLTSITKSNLQTPVMASPGGPNAVRTSSFVLVGSHKLTLASIGKTKFPLEKISCESSEGELLADMFQHKVPFLSPLEGHIYLKLQCEVGSHVEERGFLTMFEDVSGFGAWHRRWCVLSGYCVSYWTYPDDEKRKSPMGRINMANCTSRKVDPANREFCARPNTFELVTVRPQREDDKETLVSRCKNTMCVTKYWLSADTKDERNLWMRKLNQILVDLRTWQPDSCYRPL